MASQLNEFSSLLPASETYSYDSEALPLSQIEKHIRALQSQRSNLSLSHRKRAEHRLREAVLDYASQRAANELQGNINELQKCMSVTNREWGKIEELVSRTKGENVWKLGRGGAERLRQILRFARASSMDGYWSHDCNITDVERVAGTREVGEVVNLLSKSVFKSEQVKGEESEMSTSHKGKEHDEV